MREFEPKTCPEAYLMQEIERLNAQIAMLREGLSSIQYEIGYEWLLPESNIARDAMTKSASDWLDAHDAKVRDAALEESANVPGIPRISRDAIRALKGKP